MAQMLSDSTYASQITLDPATFNGLYRELSVTEGKIRPLVPEQEIRLSEIIGALSVSLDITQGHEHGHCMRSCLIGMRIAEEVGLHQADRSALFYALLLKDLGCSSNAAKISNMFAADDQSTKHSLRMMDWTRPSEMLAECWKLMAPGGSFRERVIQFWSTMRKGPNAGRELSEIRCTRGAEIADMLELPRSTAKAILDLDELWNGSGTHGKRREEISLLGRICSIAQTAEVFFTEQGINAACDVVLARKNRWFDPELAGSMESIRNDKAFWETVASENLIEELSRLEPLDRVMIADDACVDRVAAAFAWVVDAKSPWTYRHSTRVADIACGIAEQMGYAPEVIKDIRRAALLHDVGKLGVSNRILDKPGRPTDEEFAQIKRHPEYSWRILSQVDAFRELAFVSAGHHERLDGRGYHMGLSGDQIPMITRILTVADIYEALTAKRPYRDQMPEEKVRAIMTGDIGTAIDADCLNGLHAWQQRQDTASRVEDQMEQVDAVS